MTQDRNYTFVKTLRSVLVATMMLLTSGNVMAGVVVTGNVYGGGNEAEVQGNSAVNMSAGTVNENVFGGGNLAAVQGNVTVNISGGTITKDVYGGGALADTNTGNWDKTNNTWAADKSPADNTTIVNVLGGSIRDVYGGGLGRVADATNNISAIEAFVYGNTKVNLNGLENGDYVEAAHKDYVQQIAATTTNVAHYELKTTTTETETTYSKGAIVNRIFGANNLNGTPKGNITVHVFATQNASTGNIKTKNNLHTDLEEEAAATTYDVTAVYGGGNEASYIPVYDTTDGTTDYKTQVIIEGCDYTSIKTVYGGGNAAAVPETNVEIKSAYEIERVFGGGNGKDKKSDGSDNPGADVGQYKNGTETVLYGTGNANSILEGGVIHEAYGGSNQKGEIKGSINQTSNPNASDCELVMKKVVGAGKYADINGDVNMILSCQPESKIDLLFAGADEANVNGNISLTITNGNFGKVFGGNNLGGAVKGKIVVNVEETGCQPIRIDELYLGGNEAAYSVFGYYESDRVHEVTGKKILMPRVSADDNHPEVLNPATDATHSFPYAQPELNIISCTHIGKVFGGGYGEGAIMYANPTVNINMIKGAWAGKTYGSGESTVVIPDQLGEIGAVYGGGNAAEIIGNTTVNIGTETTISMNTEPAHLGEGKYTHNTGTDKYEGVAALGANITGNVFGGGNKADVSGNTFVNICAVLNPVLSTGDYTYTSVDHSGTTGFDVSIGESVYGGGSEADVKGNTRVTMTDGYVFDGVYGGGLQGSVGTFTRAALPSGHSGHTGCVNGKPDEWTDGTGKCTVVISGGQVGPVEVAMADGGMKNTGRHFKETGDPDGPVDVGFVFGAGRGTVENPADDPDADFHTYVKETEVTISGTALIMASVYGGGENGRVRGNTKVKIEGGQIGCGVGMVDANNKPIRYTDEQFIDPTETVTEDKALAECASWDFAADGKPYDPLADKPYRGSTAPVTDASTTGSDGHTYYGSVFGGGSGYYPYEIKDASNNVIGHDWLESAGLVEGNTEVVITGGHILTSVYGGNELTNVTGSCTINMVGGTVGVPRTVEQAKAHPVTCYVFGAGKGDQRINFNTWTNVGSTQVNISGNARIYGSTFGGGEDGHVLGNVETNIGGTVKIDLNGDGDTSDEGEAFTAQNGLIIGTTGTSGVDGNIFGGGRGFSETALTAGVVGGNVDVNIYNGTILGTVFGGGRLASVGTFFADATDTEKYGKMQGDLTDHTHGVIRINISGGIIGATASNGELATSDYTIGDVFGGSKGSTNNDLRFGLAKHTFITMTGGKVKGSVYGGGEVAVVEGDATIAINGGEVGDGVTKKGGAKIGNVFGGGKGNTTVADAGLIKGNTMVTVNPGSNGEPKIYHNIYGGGAYGSVGTITTGSVTYVPGIASVTAMPTAWAENTGTAEVYVYGGTIGLDGDENGMVFASSRGDVGTPEDGVDPNNRLAWVQDTKLVIGGEGKSPIIKGSVYGSGENGHVFENTIVEIHNGTIGVTTDDAFGGPNYRLRGNVYGGGCGEDTYPETDDFNPLAGIVLGTANVTIDGGQVAHNVYGAGALGSVVGKTTVTIAGSAIIGVKDAEGGNVFGAARGKEGITVPGSNLANSPETEVDINGGQVWNSVFGGGENGYVKQNVVVNMNGGVVAKDVYGGGALADTNSDNWDATKNDGAGGWATGKTSASHTTIVNLLGGSIGGDAYGGGLGRLAKEAVSAQPAQGTEGEPDYVPAVEAQAAVSAVEAKVYGDVAITLGDAAKTNATAFNISNYTGDHADVIKSGRVFGCNNLNGSPKGNVTVTVNKTVKGNTARTAEDPNKEGFAITDNSVPHTYELAAVYGGGNLADYTPTGTDKKPIVRIMTCDVSVHEVYGGGNAAAVPETDVLINGAYEIENVFGGGNGEDNYTLDGGTTWITNPGANVKGNANTILKGGYIHAGYGGSNSKGTITGDVSINKDSGGDCDLNVVEIYGAGKDADVEGDLILVMGCSTTRTEAVYGCSMNANVKGNVELTITSGEYGKVFGGNNKSGAIFGHIIVNIEETGCSPIIIDELYGCGNDAAYSTYGYYQDGTIDGTETGKPKYEARTSANDEHAYVYWGNNDDTDHTKPPYADPEVNIVSCTRIGKVFGGGLGSNATVYGNPKVNINMIKGAWAGKTYKSAAIPDKLGEIGCGYSYVDETTNKTVQVEGGVFGGGNAANVEGNTTVNIGTAETVNLIDLDADNKPVYETDGVTLKTTSKKVEGANIAGNVYGGGNLADVGQYDVANDKVDMTGNTYVNIGVVQDATDAAKYVAVPEGEKKVIITGNVFGGGAGTAETFKCEKAMVTGESYVRIGNGTVNGTVYGGGEVARVETDTHVTIGFGAGVGSGSATSAPDIKGNVFGAGKGVNTHGYAALVRGNTYVNVEGNAKIGKSIYGGGEIASVGKYQVADAAYHAAHPDVEVGMPYSTHEGGICTVTVGGYAEIGPDNMKMTAVGGPDDTGYVFGAGKGVLPYEGITGTDKPGRMKPDNSMEYYTATDYVPSGTETYEEAYLKYIETLALTTTTEVTIGGHAFVKGSIYGGSENGHVQHNTHVTIDDECQIGNGDGVNRRYTSEEWAYDGSTAAQSLKECASWPYQAPYAPYDVYKDTDNDGTPDAASDGHTFYGNVFGGGSGLYPFKRNPDYNDAMKALGYSDGVWLRSAGAVYGDTHVEIKGGHILTSVYGGNECTDVKGTTKVEMSGGTLGVPRTVDQIKAHPVTCYLFGAGKGDQRINFNTWTNVADVVVNITGGRIFGSVFGGGEDGHVLEDVTMTISGEDTKIGTTGTSYVDGNVFGGGRGFSGDAQTAGTVGGNVNMTISGGTMLGSVYGGGRLASVGTQFTAVEDPNYTNFVEDAGGKTYGHVKIDISGGTIGNNLGEVKGNEVSGNVFGGSMGRLTLLDGSINPIWPKMAQVKSSTVTVSGGTIKRTVFGGGELGSVRDNATVNISGGTVGRDVYGAGYGSDDYTTHTKITIKEPDSSQPSGYKDQDYVFTPMIFAGCVGQNTYVNISGGQVKKSVYGGGEMASVGIIDCRVKIDNTTDDPVYTDATGKYVYEKNHKHNHEDNDFILSWPYHFENREGYYGTTHVNITGGRIGLYSSQENTFEDKDNGDVCGGGKGIAGDFNNYVFCANVGSSEVTINYPSNADPQTYEASGDCIAGAVYGGAENGHVMGNTKLTLKKGLVGHSIYGGGSGKGKFTQRLLKIGKPVGSTSPSDSAYVEIYSVTAGKVFGNTEIIMEDGYVVRNVYGGGNLGSVGKGNYAGGPDDYSTAGYGEKVSGTNNLWSDQNPYGQAFLNSGKSSVTITGGTVGYIDFTKVSDYTYSGLPYGNVFGGCRGESAPNIFESPRYLYCPTFFSGYVNETDVTIGAAGSTTGPKIWGSVYGGGMDGHVRRDANVTINSGEIGRPYTGDGSDLNNVEWLYCGNVFGAGSGIGQYKYDFNYDGDYSDEFDYTNPLTGSTSKVKETDYSTSAGSVTRFTKVMVNGGTIHRNVYGGGSLSSIGAPKIGQSYNLYQPTDPAHSTEVGKQTLNEVIISGGNIGDAESHAKDYGGHVFGGSRGDASLDNSTFSTSMFTKVNMGGGKVLGSVFGGGEVGIVKGSVAVNVTGGEVESDIYGGGALANTNTENPKDADGKLTSTSTYTTTVNLLGGTINDAFGGGLGQKKDVNGDSDIEAKVFGDVTVNLNGLEPADYVPAIHSALVTDVDDTEGTYYRATGGCVVTGDIFGCNNYNGTPEGHAKVHVFKTVPKPGQAADGYDVDHVFGGGNDADYTPAASDTKQSTEVIIEGCDLTSIYQVYGGGNAAASPGTSVLVKGTKIIYEVFGGGNGESTETFENPGANVGYHTDKTEYTSGDGKSQVQLMAGNVTYAYGGSNSHGNIRGGSSVTNVTNEYSAGCCDKMTVQEIYAGGKNADMEGGAKIVMGCTNSDDWVEEVYAGAKNANVGGDVSLTLTSGKFGRVFGGNKESGILDGSITVNIEENAKCGVPLIIGELYGGGNKAAYSIYGYNADGTVKTSGEKLHASPVVNVRAFTSIGNIFGGGYGEKAVMYGSPTININVVNNNRTTGSTISTELTKTFEEGTDNEYSVKIPTHVDGKIGAINNVFGGGNAAKIYGDTNVNIGTEAKQKLVVIKDSGDPDYESDGVTPKTQEMDVVGADIRGNVYGGGNKAEVTGNTNVVIGKQSATSVTP